ncbi:MAG: YibE/F family protein [Clostridia bacterium]|nr:YibE/F family protein [Clostridia bacterium]
MKKYLMILLVTVFCFSGAIYATETPKTDGIDSGEILYDEGYEVALDGMESEYLYVQENLSFDILKGTVVEAGEVYEEDGGYTTYSYQDVKVYIKDKGYATTKVIKHSLSYYSGMSAISRPLKEGDKVLVYTTFENDNITEAAISERNNSSYIWAIVIIYSVAIILVGGKKGVKALISLILTVLAVFYIIIPQIINGMNPLLITVLVTIAIACVALLIIAGLNKKAVAAIIGTSGGIIISAIFAMIFGYLMDLSGVSEEAGTLVSVSSAYMFDFKGILYAGIIIGALGACMDVAMSLASALHELKEENPHITRSKMMKAGMNIGRDMIGTMTNTLILAYTGSSIVLIMLFIVTQESFIHIINREMMIEEILRSIAGSFGLVTTIPFTSFVTSLLMGKKERG